MAAEETEEAHARLADLRALPVSEVQPGSEGVSKAQVILLFLAKKGLKKVPKRSTLCLTLQKANYSP